MVQPLQVADPDDYLGKLLGVRIDFQASELARADLRKPADAVIGAVGDDFLFQIEQEIDGDVKEVAGTASRVQNFDVGQAMAEIRQPLLECLTQLRGAFLGLGAADGLLELGPKFFTIGLHLRPFPLQGGHEDRF